MASIPIVDVLDVSSVRLFLDVVELGQRVEGGRAPRARAAIGDGQAAEAGTPARCPAARSGADWFERDRRRTATRPGVRRPRGRRRRPRRPGRARPRRPAPADDRHHRPCRRPLPARVDRRRRPGGRAHRARRGRHAAVAQAVRSGEAAIGFTEGPAAPLGLRSEVVATEEIVAVVGRRHPWFDRRRAVSGRELASATFVVGRSRFWHARRDRARRRRPRAVGSWRPRRGGRSRRRPAGRDQRCRDRHFLPRCRVAGDLESGLLAPVRLRDLPIVQPVRAVWRGVRPAERPARRLLDAIRRDAMSNPRQ